MIAHPFNTPGERLATMRRLRAINTSSSGRCNHRRVRLTGKAPRRCRGMLRPVESAVWLLFHCPAIRSGSRSPRTTFQILVSALARPRLADEHLTIANPDCDARLLRSRTKQQPERSVRNGAGASQGRDQELRPLRQWQNKRDDRFELDVADAFSRTIRLQWKHLSGLDELTSLSSE